MAWAEGKVSGAQRERLGAGHEVKQTNKTHLDMSLVKYSYSGCFVFMGLELGLPPSF